MTVSNSWLVNVSVTANTTILPLPAFNNCMMVGVMPTQSSPYRSPPSGWGSNNWFTYTNLAAFISDFSTLLAAALFADDILQANRFQWLINDVTAFFSQSPTPNQITISALSPQTAGTNYSTFFNSLVATQNSWYGFTVADLIFANAYSICLINITTNAGGTLTAGTTATPTSGSPTSPYTLLQNFIIPSAGTYGIPFYSTDATTAIATSFFDAISPSPSFVTGVTNSAAGTVGIPGILTATNGLSVALTALRTTQNQKKFFWDTLDAAQAQIVQTAGGNKDIGAFYHSLNLQNYTAASSASFSAASLSEYFTNLFGTGVGLKVLSSMQLSGQPIDTTITTSNIGTPGSAGSSSSLINWNNNIYAGFGTATSNIGLVQYGYMTNSSSNTQVYLDQIVGQDYIQFVAQADLAAYIISQQPVGGVLYFDVGIQQVLNVFKNSMQKAVNQNIIQPFSNSNFTSQNYAYVQANFPAYISERYYPFLGYTGKFLSRIQTLAVNVSLSI